MLLSMNNKSSLYLDNLDGKLFMMTLSCSIGITQFSILHSICPRLFKYNVIYLYSLSVMGPIDIQLVLLVMNPF